MPLPNFLCVGAGKSGTTSLQNILKQHPDIYLPAVKETTFFRDENKYGKGIEFYEKRFFSAHTGQKAIGEIDPGYLTCERAPERLHKQLGGEIKLIFMLRNPLDRAYSHYLMTLRRGYETEGFEKALLLEPERMKRGNFEQEHFSYRDGGGYATHIQRYLQYFDIDKMMFIIFEKDFLQERWRTICGILNFLGVEIFPLIVDIKSNPARMPRSESLRDLLGNRTFRRILRLVVPFRQMRDKLLVSISEMNMKPFHPQPIEASARKYLIERYFAKEIEQLERIIGRDLHFWLA